MYNIRESNMATTNTNANKNISEIRKRPTSRMGRFFKSLKDAGGFFKNKGKLAI